MFTSEKAYAIWFITWSTRSSSSPLTPTTSTTSSFPVVMVPVLSRQSTLTLARPSMASISCTRARFLARRPTPRIKEILVSSTSPSGIMPITPATVLTSASEKVTPLAMRWDRYKRSPIGIITTPTTLMIRLMVSCISEVARFFVLAFFISWYA